MSTTPQKRFDVIGKGEPSAPQYARVTASLSNAEIRAELQTERGQSDAGWRKALLEEQQKRK